MRAAVFTFFLQIVLFPGLSGQAMVSIPPVPPAKWEHRTFAGKAAKASMEVLIMEGFTSTIMILLPKSITNWPEKYWLRFGSNFKLAYTLPPVWDKDPWAINYIGHPYQGAVFFNSLRSQNCSLLASACFNIFHTFLWEYGIEAIMERPSAQDLIITPITGIAFGELFNYLTKIMRRGGFSIGEKVLVTLINPSYVFNNGYR